MDTHQRLCRSSTESKSTTQSGVQDEKASTKEKSGPNEISTILHGPKNAIYDILHSLKNAVYDILHILKNAIYDCMLFSRKTAGQLLSYGFKTVIHTFLLITLILGVIYLIWEYMVKRLIILLVCQNIFGFIPIISNCCLILSQNNVGTSTTVILPIDSVVEKTVAIAERLSEVDVSAPIKIAEVKISLIDLKSNVLFSQIEEATKNQLVNGIDDVKNLATLTIDELHKMLAIFNSALARLEIYTINLHKILTKKVDHDEILERFEAYLENIGTQVDRVIHSGNEVYGNLVNLGEKTETLNTIAAEPHQIDRKKLNEIEDRNFLTRLYRNTFGNGNIEKVKYQQNVEVFNQFPDFTKAAAIKIINVINRLRAFQHEIDEIKFTVSKLVRGQTLQLDLHLEILTGGMESLKNYKNHLNGRIAERNKN